MLNFIMAIALVSSAHGQVATCPYNLDQNKLSSSQAKISVMFPHDVVFNDLTEILLDKFVNDYLKRRRLLLTDLPRTDLFSSSHASEMLSAQLKAQLKNLITNLPNNLEPENFKAGYEKKITDLLRLRDHDSKKEIVYNRDFDNPLDLAFDGKMQCYSGTMLHLLLARMYYGEKKYNWYQFIAIFKSGHILPGYLKVKDNHIRALIGVEQTGDGASTIKYGNVRDIKGKIRLLNSDDFLRMEAVKDLLSEDPSNQTYSCLLSKTASELRLKHFAENERLIEENRKSDPQYSGSAILNQNPLAFQTDDSETPEEGDQTRNQLNLDEEKEDSERKSKFHDSKKIPQHVISLASLSKSGNYNCDKIFQSAFGIRYRFCDGGTVEFLDDLQNVVGVELIKIRELITNHHEAEAIARFDLMVSEFTDGLNYKSMSIESQISFLKRLCSLPIEFPYILDLLEGNKEMIRVFSDDFELSPGFRLSDFEQIEETDEPLVGEYFENLFIDRIRAATKDRGLVWADLQGSENRQTGLFNAYRDALRPELTEEEKYKRFRILFNAMNIEFEFSSVDQSRIKTEKDKMLRTVMLKLGSSRETMEEAIRFFETRRPNGLIFEHHSKIIIASPEAVTSLISQELLIDDQSVKHLRKLDYGYLNSLGQLVVSSANPGLQSLWPYNAAENCLKYRDHNSKLMHSALLRTMHGTNIVIERGLYSDLLTYEEVQFQDYISKLIIGSKSLQASLRKNAIVGLWVFEQSNHSALSDVSVERFSKRIFVPFNPKLGPNFDSKIIEAILSKLSI